MTYQHLLEAGCRDHLAVIKKVLANRYGKADFKKIIGILSHYDVCEDALHRLADAEQIKVFNTYIEENRIRRKKYVKKK